MMTVRINYTVDVDGGYCRAIRHYVGRVPGNLAITGTASRTEVKAWFKQHGRAMDDVLRAEHAKCYWGEQPETEKEE